MSLLTGDEPFDSEIASSYSLSRAITSASRAGKGARGNHVLVPFPPAPEGYHVTLSFPAPAAPAPR